MTRMPPANGSGALAPPVAGLLVAALGVAVLVGWFLDIGTLKTVLPTLVTMKANTAVGLVLCGLALAGLSWPSRNTRRHDVELALATLVVMLGTGTLAQYLLGIDRMLGDTLTSVDAGQRARMSAATAFCFVLAGSALILAWLPTHRRLRQAGMAALAIALFVVAVLALAGNLAEAILHERWWNYTGMALHSALGFIVLGSALFGLVVGERRFRWAMGAPATTGFAAAILVMLVSTGVEYGATRRYSESATWVSHTHEVMTTLESIASGMADLESGQRGFLLLGEEDLLERRDQVRANVAADVRELRRLVADNASQLRRLDHLEPVLAERTQFGDETIALRRQEGVASAQAMVAGRGGMLLTGQLKAMLAEMKAEETRLLGIREAQSRAAFTTTFLMLPLSVFLSLTLLSLGLFFLNAGVAGRDAAERALRESEELFSKAFMLSPDYVSIVRAGDRVLLKANEAICRLLDQLPDEVIGKPSNEFAEWSDADERAVFMRKLKATGECLSTETRLRFCDGRELAIVISARTIVLNGEPCILSVLRDVTEQKAAQQALRASEERYHSTLDSILESCQLIGFDWKYLYLNDAAAIQNRRPNSELLGRTMPDSWPGIVATGVFAMLERCMVERIALHDEIEFVFPDGTSGWFDVRGQPAPEGIFVLSNNISERRNAEDSLRELNETLELKVASRTSELEAALLRAEAADGIKAAFLATMSHELRTPLNSIIGFTGIVLQGYAGPLNPVQTRQLGLVMASARHLLELINDVLDLSKIEAGQMEMSAEPFDLQAALDQAVEQIAPMAEKKGLRLMAMAEAVDVRMFTDRRRVDQILLNLLSNAVKFTEQGSVTVDVELVDGTEEVLRADRREVHIRIVDTGIGIRPEDLPILFLPFRQLDSSLTRRHDGSGLGLAICARLSGLLGGSIHATSDYGNGSTFLLVLPVDPRA